MLLSGFVCHLQRHRERSAKLEPRRRLGAEAEAKKLAENCPKLIIHFDNLTDNDAISMRTDIERQPKAKRKPRKYSRKNENYLRR